MSVYGFDESLSKVNAITEAQYYELSNRITSLENYGRESYGNITSSARSYVSYEDPGDLYRRWSVVSAAFTFNTIANVPAYTTIANIPNTFRPKQRHYFTDSTGLRFMITVTGYIQNVDALPSGKEHIIGTSYMGKNI